MLQKNNGFTLFEMLITLTIFMIILTLIPLIFRIVSLEIHAKHLNVDLEWEVFLQQSKVELRRAERIEIYDKRVYMYMSYGDVISYEMYDDKLRKRVNNKGHEVILQGVKDVSFSLQGNGYTVQVTDQQSRTHSARLAAYQKIESVNDE